MANDNAPDWQGGAASAIVARAGTVAGAVDESRRNRRGRGK